MDFVRASMTESERAAESQHQATKAAVAEALQEQRERDQAAARLGAKLSQEMQAHSEQVLRNRRRVERERRFNRDTSL